MPSDREFILPIKLDHIRCEAVRPFEPGQSKQLALKPEPMAQDIQRPFDFQFLEQILDQHGCRAIAMQFVHASHSVGCVVRRNLKIRCGNTACFLSHSAFVPCIQPDWFNSIRRKGTRLIVCELLGAS